MGNLIESIMLIEQTVIQIKSRLRNQGFNESEIDEILSTDPTLPENYVDNNKQDYQLWIQKIYKQTKEQNIDFELIQPFLYLDLQYHNSYKKQLPETERDIGRFKTHQDLRNQLEKYSWYDRDKPPEKATAKERKKEEEQKRIETQFQNAITTNNWIIIDIDTREQMIEQGKNTKWCLAQTNISGKTLKDIYREQFDEIWKADNQLSNMFGEIMQKLNLPDFLNEQAFEQFFAWQMEQMRQIEPKIFTRQERETLDDVTKAYKIMFMQYKAFENYYGDGHMWVQIYKKNPYLKFAFFFGIYEFRDQANNKLDMNEFVKGTLKQGNITYEIEEEAVLELVEFFENYNNGSLTKQIEVINEQRTGHFDKDYINFLRKLIREQM